MTGMKADTHFTEASACLAFRCVLNERIQGNYSQSQGLCKFLGGGTNEMT